MITVPSLQIIKRNPLLLLSVLIGSIVPLIIAAVSGNISIPHNDAWAYSRIAQTFGHAGVIDLVGWNRSALIGQIVVLGPLARSIIVQQVFVALLAIIFLVAVYDLLRETLSKNIAGIATIALSLWPGFALLSTSYMADIPTAATAFLSLAVARRAFKNDSRLWFVMALVVALWSCSIRAQALAAPAAIVLYGLLKRREMRRVNAWWLVGGAVGFSLVFAVFTWWQSQLPRNDPAAFLLQADTLSSVGIGLVRSWFTLSLVVGPVSVAFSPPWRWRRRGWVAFACVGVVGFLALHQLGPQSFLMGNYINQSGAYADVLSMGKSAFGDTAWTVLVAFAFAMGMFAAAAVAESSGHTSGLLAAFALFTLVGTVGEFATTQGVFDRYLIPFVPWILALACTPRHPPLASEPALRRVVSASMGVALLGVLASFSALLALNAWASDRARWDIGVEMSASVPANRIDAGFEWLGWHSSDGVIVGGAGWGWQSMFSTRPSCVVVLGNPAFAQQGWTLIREHHYATFLVAGSNTYYVYAVPADGCPAVS